MLTTEQKNFAKEKSYHYYQMYDWIAPMITRYKLTAISLYILVELYQIISNNDDKKKHCIYSNDRFAEKFNCPLRTVERCLSSLRKAGLIKIAISNVRGRYKRKIYITEKMHLYIAAVIEKDELKKITVREKHA